MGAVWTEQFEEDILTDLNTTVSSGTFNGVLSSCKMVLFTNVVALTPKTLLAALTQPTYTGYAPQTATFAGIFRRFEGGIAINTALLRWVMSNTTTPTNVYGYAITDEATPPNLLFAEQIPNGPIQLIDTLDSIEISAQVALGGPDFGSATINY